MIAYKIIIQYNIIYCTIILYVLYYNVRYYDIITSRAEFGRISYGFRVGTKIQIFNIIIFHTFCNIISIDHYVYDFIGLHQWFSNCETLYAEGRVVVLRNFYTSCIKKHFKTVSSNLYCDDQTYQTINK